MSTLRELSRPYQGEYECETLTYGGRDLLGEFVYFRLSLENGEKAKLSWKRRAGGEGEKRLSYRAQPEEGFVELICGDHARAFPLGKGKIELSFIVCGRLLYAVFAM